MGNAPGRPSAKHLYIEHTPTLVSSVVAAVTPGAPPAGDLSAATTIIVYTCPSHTPVPVLKKGETLLQRVIVKLEPPEGEGWKLYEKCYDSIYDRNPSKMYWSRKLNPDDFEDK